MTADNPTESQEFPREWWLTLADLCELLSVAPALWESWQTAGTAPAHTAGPDGVTRVHRADLAAWLDRKRTLSGSQWLTIEEARELIRTRTRPNIAPANPDEWLTVPDICAEIDATPEEWQAWRILGNTPPHAVLDGTARVRRGDLDAWLDALPTASLFDVIDPDEGEGS
ncbi:hypothetical protein SAMN04489713_111127 [Actinomadura madurae]|uniref:Helix-turn-helix domain-containing protein n=1 Tax=Actinomadura madurae TaxID=1993 RepID=A0A1I5M2E9_9ACTN|nr:helix-turn-helix domain-containing protein [Actinomadura madurae]SFP03643.1 hypothetical protein SAMN04489713_111127 [Actinomadura madurae]